MGQEIINAVPVLNKQKSMKKESGSARADFASNEGTTLKFFKCTSELTLVSLETFVFLQKIVKPV